MASEKRMSWVTCFFLHRNMMPRSLDTPVSRYSAGLRYFSWEQLLSLPRESLSTQVRFMNPNHRSRMCDSFLMWYSFTPHAVVIVHCSYGLLNYFWDRFERGNVSCASQTTTTTTREIWFVFLVHKIGSSQLIHENSEALINWGENSTSLQSSEVSAAFSVTNHNASFQFGFPADRSRQIIAGRFLQGNRQLQ